jgi:hypothetical protein
VTVRTWITISILTLVALFAAAGVKIFTPLRPPALLAGVGRVRLHGVARGACWPQRSDALRCEGASGERAPRAALPRSGVMHVVAAYPFQPDAGSLRIDRGSRPVVDSAWTGDLRYELEPGTYVLHAEARYKRGAYVRYDFAFRIR